MAKPELWRMEASHYPACIEVPPRFQDLDTLGHINNVALADMFENARVHFHRRFGSHPSDMRVRWLVAAVDLKYVAESHFPHPLEFYSAVGHVGNSSWSVIQAAFQDGKCVATCDTVMVMHGPRGKTSIPDEMRAIMHENMPVRD